MRVRYNVLFGVLIVVVGAVNLVLAVLRIQQDGSVNLWGIFWLLFTLIGALHLVRDYFEFDPATCTIAVKAILGLTRRVGGANGGLLYLDGDRIMCIDAKGRTRRVPVSRFVARGDQWRAVVEYIEQAPITGPTASS